MGKIVDADELYAAFRHDIMGGLNWDRILREAKPVDAVEVVRCRDCKWRDDQKGATEWMPCRALVTPDDFYCPSGERKGKRQ